MDGEINSQCIRPPQKREASIQAAIRELREETGLRAYDVRYLFKFHESKIFKYWKFISS